jgi:hypothetical protein
MRVLAGAMAVMLLAGCAKSITELRQAGPEARLYSSKSVDDVSKCIVFAWQGFTSYGDHLEVFMLPSRGGGSTVFTRQNQFVVDVDPTQGRTQVLFFQSGDGNMSRTLLGNVKSCL